MPAHPKTSLALALSLSPPPKTATHRRPSFSLSQPPVADHLSHRRAHGRPSSSAPLTRAGDASIGVRSERTLMEDEPEKYQSHFSEYIKEGIDADGLEAMYKKVHAAIRAHPTAKKSGKQPPKEHKRYNLEKLTYEERKVRQR